MADLSIAIKIASTATTGGIDATSKALSGITGTIGGVTGAVGKMVSALGSIGLAKAGIDAVAGAAKGLGGALGVGLASEMEGVQAQLLAFTKSGAATEQLLKQIRSEADKTPFSFQAMAQATVSLLPASKQAGVGIMDLIRQAEILAALNPGEGLTGAAFSLREALSGDFVSIVERFNLPRTAINELKAQGVPALEIVSRALQGMGADMSLVTNLAGTTAGRLSTFNDSIDGLRVAAGRPILNALGEQLDRLSGFIDANREEFTAFATALGTTIANAIEQAGRVMLGLFRVFDEARSVFRGTVTAAEGLNRIGDIVEDVFGRDVGAVFRAVIDLIGGDFRGAWGRIEGYVDDALSRASGIVGGFVSEVQARFADFAPTGERLGEVFEFIGDRIEDVLPQLRDLVQDVADAGEAAGGAEGLLRRFADTANVTSGAAEGLVGWIGRNREGLEQLGGVLIIASAGVAGFRSVLLIQAIAAGAAALATGGFATALTAARTGALLLNAALMANPIGFVVGLIAALAAGLVYAYATNEKFRASVDEAWARLTIAAGVLRDTVIEKIGELRAFFSSLPDRFRADAVGTGVAIIQGIAQGLNPAALISHAWNIGQQVLATIRASVDARSPSQEAAEIGSDIVEGLAEGITDNTEMVVAAAGELAEAVLETVPSAFAELSSALGAVMPEVLSIVQQAERDAESARAEVQRKYHRDQEIEQTKHERRMADLQRELREATAGERKGWLERITEEQTNHQRRLEDLTTGHNDRLIELEYDLGDRMEEAQRRQALQRGAALDGFLRGLDELEADVARQSEAIATKLQDNLAEAAKDAGRAARDAISRAAEQIRDLESNRALNLAIRARRDVFGGGQDTEQRRFREAREDADLLVRHQEDLAKRTEKIAQETRDLERRRDRENADAEYQLAQDLEEAKTDADRDAIRARFEQQRRDRDRRRAMDDEERRTRLREEDRALEAAFQKAQADLQRRRAREQEERAFRAGQEKAARDFSDQLETEALARQIGRIGEERDERVRSIRIALSEKQAEIEKQAAQEREKLAQSYRDKVQDLRTEFLEKFGPIMGEAQTMLANFLQMVAGRTAETAAAVLGVGAAAAQAATGSPLRPGGKPGETPSEVLNYYRNLGQTPPKEVVAAVTTQAAAGQGQYPTQAEAELAGILKPGENFRNLASGGWLTEPVTGVGRHTGDRYNLAEAGPEYIGPASHWGGGLTAAEVERIVVRAVGAAVAAHTHDVLMDGQRTATLLRPHQQRHNNRNATGW